MQTRALITRRASATAQKVDDALGDYPRKFQAYVEIQG
jgi:hypothetical protein